MQFARRTTQITQLSMRPLTSKNRVCRSLRWALLIVLNAAAVNGNAAEDRQWLQFRDSDQRYLELALARVNDLSQRTLGSSLQQRRQHDLALLQRLLDRRAVSADQRYVLQGMGVALGELLRRECSLKWGLYRDRYGQSRALKSRHSQQALFPITMVSRRIEAGLEVDISALYQNAKQRLQPPCGKPAQ